MSSTGNFGREDKAGGPVNIYVNLDAFWPERESENGPVGPSAFRGCTYLRLRLRFLSHGRTQPVPAYAGLGAPVREPGLYVHGSSS